MSKHMEGAVFKIMFNNYYTAIHYITCMQPMNAKIKPASISDETYTRDEECFYGSCEFSDGVLLLFHLL